MLMINGVACHETGCPDSWKRPSNCAFCGSRFSPETRFQSCCSHSCQVAYDGASCDCSECEEDFRYLDEIANPESEE